jgi:hypothetical protein
LPNFRIGSDAIDIHHLMLSDDRVRRDISQAKRDRIGLHAEKQPQEEHQAHSINGREQPF